MEFFYKIKYNLNSIMTAERNLPTGLVLSVQEKRADNLSCI